MGNCLTDESMNRGQVRSLVLSYLKKSCYNSELSKVLVPRGGSTALKENKDLEKKWDNFFP
jgi:hypothetical protein